MISSFPVVELEDAEFYFEGREFLPSRVAKEIVDSLQMYRLVTPKTLGGKPTIWEYNRETGIFTPDGDPSVRQWVKHMLGEKATPHRINQVVELVKIDTYIDPRLFMREEPRKMVCLNGVLNLETGDLEGFNPELFAKSRIPVKYDPDATCPEVEVFLEEVVGVHSITVTEFAGYCLWKEMPIHRFVTLEGKGANGKGTLIDFLTAFIGENNISNVALQALDGSRFMSAQLHGKLANFYMDLSASALKNTGTLKGLTAGDRMSAQNKFRDPFDFRSHAKILVSCNELPPTFDQAEAFFRRYIGIPCDAVFVDGDNAEQNILERLTTPENLSGFLNLALKALTSLLERGRFLLEESIEEKRVGYIKRSNLIQYFAITQVSKSTDIESTISNAQFYSTYTRFCRLHEKIPKDSGVFGRQVRKFLPYADQGTATVGDRRGVKVWRGITVASARLPQKDKTLGEYGEVTE